MLLKHQVGEFGNLEKSQLNEIKKYERTTKGLPQGWRTK